ncbi:hypothetical protein JNUCC1_03819 [Lentibacillus sp. JNUCC-1]|uniref:DUF342 domain-containing protein n=1 Tax=Lentibacillus sp. JNUCC-1 TaxID=2654513 RepID=UPI001329F3BF|nr:FapA family protein [Lentibacillus sp. JNUCC-1]MUV39935.1 hypothetical protein [Lentibacillus sp. JNUCC-1]
MADDMMPYQITITDQNMQVIVTETRELLSDTPVTEESMKALLQDRKIVHGVDWKAINRLVHNPESINFPLVIAQGNQPVNGIDGDISFKANLTTDLQGEKNSFRDVMRIPSARKGEQLATLIDPQPGKDGIDVFGKIVSATPGRPCTIKAGKNVVFRPADSSFYAASEGQISVSKRHINIHNVYDVAEDLSMKTGNINFVGTIIIHGTIPTGYTVQAEGDIKVFGTVEAAHLTAGGSIYISEGLSGQSSGSITAGIDVHAGYINQGIIKAGQDIYVDKSIIHSTCEAKNNIYCHKGSIIGGHISAGSTLEVKDLGNRMNSLTKVYLGPDQSELERITTLTEQQADLIETLEKLTLLGDKLANAGKNDSQSDKISVMKLKQKKSYAQTKQKLAHVEKELYEVNTMYGNEEKACLNVFGTLYRNVVAHFGKYAETIQHDRKAVQLRLLNRDILIQPLQTD